MQIHTVSAGGEHSVPWMNASGVAPSEVEPHVREVAMKLSAWMTDQKSDQGAGSLFNRKAYQAPANPYAAMLAARLAVETDDLVSGTADVTEGLMLQGVKWESEVEDDADIFNQIAAKLNLDAYLRAAHRELFTYSQVITAAWWDTVTYKVRGRTPPDEKPLVKVTDTATGVVRFEEPRDPKTNRPIKPKRGAKRRKEYHVYAPVALSILDPLKVVPIGGVNVWGYERLAWAATPDETETWDRVDAGQAFDLTMSRLFLGRYTPGKAEAAQLADWGIDTKNLMELNPRFVWRHTLSKSSYEQFPDLRMKSIFKLLDLKQQLMEADRVALIGAANYLMLVKKGTKEDPAYPEELRNLRENFDVVAKVPVIISDHRLEIEIITPKQDYTLQGEKYDTLDRRIMARLIGAMGVASSGQRNESTLTTGRMVARLLESRRHMLKRAVEHQIAHAVVDHPANDGKFEDEPNLAFTPRNVQLDADAQVVQSIMALRAQKELSRGSTLEFFGFDQEVEAQRREYEDESGLDSVFGTQVPFNGENANAGGTPPPPPQVTGPQGGRPSGGGAPTKNAAKPQTRNRTPAKG